MGMAVVMGAKLMCTFGQGPPASLSVTRLKPTAEGKACANVMDFTPMKNIPSFGMCTSPNNPQVIAAQGAPQSCTPVVTSPWKPGCPKFKIENMNALNNTSKAMCQWAGMISISDPGQTKLMIP